MKHDYLIKCCYIIDKVIEIVTRLPHLNGMTKHLPEELSLIAKIFKKVGATSMFMFIHTIGSMDERVHEAAKLFQHFRVQHFNISTSAGTV